MKRQRRIEKNIKSFSGLFLNNWILIICVDTDGEKKQFLETMLLSWALDWGEFHRLKCGLSSWPPCQLWDELRWGGKVSLYEAVMEDLPWFLHARFSLPTSIAPLLANLTESCPSFSICYPPGVLKLGSFKIVFRQSSNGKKQNKPGMWGVCINIWHS